MSNRLVALLLLLALVASAVSGGCSKKNEEKPRPEIPKDGLKGVTPKSAVAPKLQPSPP
jgi:hypothetical protein